MADSSSAISRWRSSFSIDLGALLQDLQVVLVFGALGVCVGLPLEDLYILREAPPIEIVLQAPNVFVAPAAAFLPLLVRLDVAFHWRAIELCLLKVVGEQVLIAPPYGGAMRERV